MTDSSTTPTDALSTLSATVLSIIQQHTGLHEHLATPIRDDIIAALRRNYASERVYIPGRAPVPRETLLQKMQDEFDGTTDSREAFCKRHHISRRTFYRINKNLADGMKPLPMRNDIRFNLELSCRRFSPVSSNDVLGAHSTE